MISIEQADTVRGRTMVGTDGNRIGKVGEVFLDDQTGRPEWATVATGLFGTRESFVPLAEASLTEDGVTVPYTKDRVKGAPNVDTDGELSQQEEATLYSYYGMDYSERTSDSGLPAAGTTATTGTATTGTATTGTSRTAGTTTGTAATSGAIADDVPIDVRRSQEQLAVGVQRVETGRARLRKYVVTEQQSATVAVAHDELTVTREPITDANRGNALDGPAISEEVHEVVLTEERAVVDKDVVPVERIKLDKQTVRESETVSADVRKEEVELIDPKGVRTDVDSDPTA